MDLYLPKNTGSTLSSSTTKHQLEQLKPIESKAHNLEVHNHPKVECRRFPCSTDRDLKIEKGAKTRR